MSDLNFMIHTGGYHVERQQLNVTETPLPTKTWTPIPHWQLVDEVEKSLQGSGFNIVQQAHALARNDSRYFGMFEIANGKNSDEYSTVVGLRNSHDKSFPAGLVIGSGVFVCDNLCFSGEIKFGRRHTSNIVRDLTGLVDAAVGRINNLRVTQDQRLDAYKQAELSIPEADHLLIELLRARVVTATKIPKILKEYNEPSHPEFIKDGETVWRFFNAVTEHLKGGLADLPRVGQALHGIMDGAAGLVIEHDSGLVTVE
jgi:hypothetical protein